MKTGGFKRMVVLGMAAGVLVLAGGCRNEQRGGQEGQQQQGQPQQGQPQQPVPGTGGAGGSGAEPGQQPEDLNRLPEEDGLRSVPEQQELPSGIGQDGRGGSGAESEQDAEQRQ